jgi:hypothetical protein
LEGNFCEIANWNRGLKNKAPDKPFLPPPVITSWRTWLDDTEKFEDFCAVINEIHRGYTPSARNIATNV